MALSEGCLSIAVGLEFAVRWLPEATLATVSTPQLPVGQKLAHGKKQSKLQEMDSTTTFS